MNEHHDVLSHLRRKLNIYYVIPKKVFNRYNLKTIYSDLISCHFSETLPHASPSQQQSSTDGMPVAQSTPIPRQGDVPQPETSTASMPNVNQQNAPAIELDVDVDMPSPVPNQNETDNGFGPENLQDLVRDARRALNLSGEDAQDAPQHVRRMSRILSQERNEEPQVQVPTEEDRPIRRVSSATATDNTMIKFNSYKQNAILSVCSCSRWTSSSTRSSHPKS